MVSYLDSSGRFSYNHFKYDLLRDIVKAAMKIKLPPDMRVVTTNKDFQNGRTKCIDDCSRRLKYSINAINAE